jgi:hypothetical protein
MSLMRQILFNFIFEIKLDHYCINLIPCFGFFNEYFINWGFYLNTLIITTH